MRTCGVCLMMVMLAVAGCGGDDDDGTVGGAGTTLPAAGTMAGTSAAGTGTAGASAGRTGGAGTTGGAGMTGSAGATAGMGAAGSSGGGVPGCSAAPSPAAAGPMLHMAVMQAITQTMGAQASCAGSTSCHRGSGKAGLVLDGTMNMNLNMLLVGKMSCEAPMVPLVASGGGDTALNNSWLWLKLTAPVDGSANLVSNTAWGTPGNCSQMPGTYGVRMPQGFSGTTYLSAAQLDPIRNWICAGAPGP